MATKKVSAKKVVAEQPVKTAKSTTPSPVAKKVEVPAKAVKATAKPVAKKVEVPTKAVKATAKPAAKKVEVPAKAVKVTPAPVAAKAVAAKMVATSKVTFTLPKEVAENAETVAVLGDFNNWQKGVSLKKQKDGSFTAAVELEKGRTYEFRFLINGEKWENAPNAEAYKPTPFGAYNSVVTA